MKRIVAGILTTVMVAGIALSTAAAPSISQIIPENPQVIEGNLNEKEELIVQNANPDAYENEKVAETVAKANDENNVTTVEEILTDLGVDTEKEITTESGEIVNPTLYEQVTPFVDLALKEGDQVKYETEGEITASVTIEAAKGMDADEVLLMQIDPFTGEVYFIVPESVNPETGEIVATFPTLGPFCLLEPSDIVSKSVDTDQYESKETKKVVSDFKNEGPDMELSDVVNSIENAKGLPGEDDTNVSWFNKNMIPSVVMAADSKNSDTVKSLTVDGKLQIADNISIPVKEYSSVMGFADLAIKFGKENYLYKMSGSFQADVHRSLENVDWKRIVLNAYPDFDIEEAEEDMSCLTELEPFTLTDGFIMQMNPFNGDVEYYYEPEVYFAYPEDASKIETPEKYLYKWKVEDEEKKEAEMPNLVINATYKSMGPFTVFMPKAEQEVSDTAAAVKSFSIWWILLVLILIIAAGSWFVYKKKKHGNKR